MKGLFASVLWQSVDGESAEPIPSTADVILDQSNSFNAVLYCMMLVDNHLILRSRLFGFIPAY